MPKHPFLRRLSAGADVALGVLILIVATILAVIGYFGQGVDFTVRMISTVVGVLLYVVGAGLYRRGKKATAATADELLAVDARPPVLFLRSFKDDPVGAAVPESPYGAAFAVIATEEQQIAEVFSEIGPVIAIGKPGERLPELGAARLYVPHDQWQHKVSELMAQSRLVLFRASDTQGFHWEVEHGGQRLPPEKIVFLIPAQSNYRVFCRAAERLLPVRFPEEPRKQRRCGSLSGLVYFDADWQSRFVAPRNTWFRNQLRKPMISVLKVMAEPVFRQLGVPWSPPPVRWGLYALCLSVFLVPLVIIAVAVIVKWLAG